MTDNVSDNFKKQLDRETSYSELKDELIKAANNFTVEEWIKFVSLFPNDVGYEILEACRPDIFDALVEYTTKTNENDDKTNDE